MIITCPTCATRYEAALSAFEPEGRKVRCSACGHEWLQFPADPEMPQEAGSALPDAWDDAPDDSDDAFGDGFADGADGDGEREMVDIESEAARLAAASRRASAGFAARKAMRMRLTRGWVALAACLALFVAGGYHFRVDVVEVFPAAARIYAELGLEVNIRGLAFRNIAYGQDVENGIPVMAIKGEIVNIDDEPQVPPRVRFSLLNEARQEIYHWTMRVERGPLAPDAALPFTTRLASPPSAARNIQIRFARVAR